MCVREQRLARKPDAVPGQLARIVRKLQHVQAREHAARAATAQATLSARTARHVPRRARSIRESATV